MAFSGCVDVWSGLVSSNMTLERSRLRYERSYTMNIRSKREKIENTAERLTLTIFPFMERVASRNKRWPMKKLYRSSLSSIGPAVCNQAS